MPDRNLRELIGFIMFWVGTGILLNQLMPGRLFAFLTAAGFLLGGYSMFSRR